MNKYRKILAIATLLLISFGILMIYSSSSIWAEYKFNDSFKFLKAQLLFLGLGLFLVYIINKLNDDFFKKYANWFLFISLVLLVLVLIPGIGKVRNGSRSWFGFGPLGIQPSEFTKLSIIIFSAKYLARNDSLVKNIKKGILPLFLVICLIFLLIMLEPDFGTGMVLVLTTVVMIFIAGPDIKFFLKIGLLGLIGISVLIIIAPYRMQRIVSYLNPWSDPLGSGFQIIQSLYAMGPHGLLGLGFGNSIQKNFYLPEPQTDFIFSIIGEEFGFLGCLFVISLFIIIFYASLRIALAQYDLFKKYLCFGLAFGITLQGLLNITIVSGLLPTTGITLPFISYGGSSLLVSMVSIGIILNIAKNT